MAGEELLSLPFDNMATFEHMGEDRAVVLLSRADYARLQEALDAHRQRAGEDGSEEVTGACVTLTVLPEEADAVRSFLRDCRAPDPATVRVPREPTEAMLEAGDECSHYMVHCKKVWDAMIAAASSPTAEDVRDAERRDEDAD